MPCKCGLQLIFGILVIGASMTSGVGGELVIGELMNVNNTNRTMMTPCVEYITSGLFESWHYVNR